MLESLAFAILLIVLVVAAVWDLRTAVIPNWLTYPAIVAGFFLWAWHPGGMMTGLQQAAIGFAVGFVPMAFLFSLGGLGGGDVKLMGGIGAICANWMCVIDTAVYALIVALLMAIFLMIRHRLVKRTFKRLFIAAFLALNKTKSPMPQDSPNVAFGLALAIGGTLAAMDHLLGVTLPWSQWVY